jgi:hypothetical protein
MRLTKSREMRWTGHIECMGETINMSNILAGKPERKRENLET